MKRFAKCAFLMFAAVLSFEYAYLAATWIMDGELTAFEATESIAEAHRHFAFDVVIGTLAK